MDGVAKWLRRLLLEPYALWMQDRTPEQHEQW
jgi:hypothetical protein